MNERKFLKTIATGVLATACSLTPVARQESETCKVTKIRQVRFRELISLMEYNGVSRWRIFHAIADYVLSAESQEHCFIVTPIHAELIQGYGKIDRDLPLPVRPNTITEGFAELAMSLCKPQLLLDSVEFS